MSILDEYINKIFDVHYPCEVTSASLSILYNRQVGFVEPEPYKINFGTVDFFSGITVTEINNNDEGIKDMLLGRSRFNVGEEFYKYTNSVQANIANLSTSDMAEILYKGGSIKIYNPLDSVPIYNDLGGYLSEVENWTSFVPGYIPPPAEDIEALTDLHRMLSTMAISNMQAGLGKSTISRLNSLLAITATSPVKRIKGSVSLNGVNKSAILSDDTSLGKFKFDR